MNYLAHHGVLGMKWGVRRYQNKDGSLTPEGKRHMKAVQADASKMAYTHAQLEDMNRVLTRNVKKDNKILVSSETKKEFTRLLNEYERLNQLFSEKYEYAESSIIKEKGEDYVYTLLQDKETGWGAYTKVKLNEKS